MSEEANISPDPQSPPPSSPPPVGAPTAEKSGGGCFKVGCLALIIILVLLIVGGLIGWWIANRPHSDVNLSSKEQAVVEKKIETLQDKGVPDFLPADTDSAEPQDNAVQTISNATSEVNALAEVTEEDVWEDDEIKRVIRFTQREINGWLTQEPNLKDLVRIELGEDEVTARLHVQIPDDFPIWAGKKVKVKGRIKVIINQSRAHASIESLTFAGIPVPSAFIGAVQGDNLLEQTFDTAESLETFHKIVEEFSINSDGVTIRLAE